MMPVLFVGHGSPMNAIEDNEITRGWREISKAFDKPVAILCISAHWYTDRTRILSSLEPRTIHDFYGFPRELHAVQYPAKGEPTLVAEVEKLLGSSVARDDSWGLDHGSWSVLVHMYPESDVPVVQLSIDAGASTRQLYEIGTLLRPLREQGVLILGSGNVVHNLTLMDMSNLEGYTWAVEFDDHVRTHVCTHEHDQVLHYEQAGPCAGRAFRTREHFDPLLVVLGASHPSDPVHVFNRKFFAGSVSMTSYRIG